MNKNNLLLTGYLVTAMILFLSGCSGDKKNANGETAETEKSNSKDISVKTVKVIPSEYSEYGEYYGKVEGIEEATLLTFSGGTIEDIFVKEGDFVKKGQSLGRIDADKAQAVYDLAVLNEKVARQTYERQVKFLNNGNTSQLTVDQSKLAWLNTKNNLLDARKMWEGAFCISPITGIVLNSYIDLHQETAAGTPTFRVALMNKVKVSFGIPEQEITGVSLGNPAEISLSMFPGQSWGGSLKRLSREVSPMPLTFEAEIEVTNDDLQLPSGVTARVKLLRQSLPDALVIPSEAILTQEDETYVMVDSGGVASKRLIVPGSTDQSHTIVLKGLEGGESLIVDGNHLVVEGSSLLVLK